MPYSLSFSSLVWCSPRTGTGLPGIRIPWHKTEIGTALERAPEDYRLDAELRDLPGLAGPLQEYVGRNLRAYRRHKGITTGASPRSVLPSCSASTSATFGASRRGR